MTKVIYYINEGGDNPVSDFLDKLEQAQQAKLLRIVSHIKMYGLLSVLPHVKKLTGIPLWEIRILGKDNIRVIYAVAQKDTVLLLHGFIKKSQKTPMKELLLAMSRLIDWRKNHA